MSADQETIRFDDPSDAWNLAMKYVEAYARSLDNLDAYEFEGSEEEPELLIFEGDMEEALQDFTNVLRDALEARARELGI